MVASIRASCLSFALFIPVLSGLDVLRTASCLGDGRDIVVKQGKHVVSTQRTSCHRSESQSCIPWTHVLLIDLHTLLDDSDVITRTRAQ